MMTPKEALAKDGTVPVSMGRGRLSREGIERCKVLVAQGWKIKGYALDTAPSKSVDQPVTVKKVAASNEKVVQEYIIKYDVDLYEAVTAEGRTFTMKEVCNACGVSLVQNHCDNPTVLGLPVTIRFK
jgi:hypothetical protein